VVNAMRAFTKESPDVITFGTTGPVPDDVQKTRRQTLMPQALKYLRAPGTKSAANKTVTRHGLSKGSIDNAGQLHAEITEIARRIAQGLYPGQKAPQIVIKVRTRIVALTSLRWTVRACSCVISLHDANIAAVDCTCVCVWLRHLVTR
jgi:hypothetical protein